MDLEKTNKSVPFFGQQRTSILVLLFATLYAFAGIAVSNNALINEVAPLGIVSLQLAYDLPSALEILTSWSETERLNASFNLGLDYLFLLSYSLLLSAGCSYLALMEPRSWRGSRQIGLSLSWCMFAAGVLDMIENYALLKLLLGSMNASLPRLASLCAIPKFGIVTTGLAYIAFTGLKVVVGRRSPND